MTVCCCPVCTWSEAPTCGWPVRQGDQILGCPRPATRGRLCDDHAALSERWSAEADALGKAMARAVMEHLASQEEPKP